MTFAVPRPFVAAAQIVGYGARARGTSGADVIESSRRNTRRDMRRSTRHASAAASVAYESTSYAGRKVSFLSRSIPGTMTDRVESNEGSRDKVAA